MNKLKKVKLITLISSVLALAQFFISMYFDPRTYTGKGFVIAGIIFLLIAIAGSCYYDLLQNKKN